MATDSTLRPGELKDILLREIAAADLASTDVSEVGTVLEVRDGVARIYGLQSAIASEMLEFTAQETGETVAGLVLNLEEDNVGAAIMGDYLKLKEGDQVRRTGRLLDVPVGPAMLGRVVDALGRPGDLFRVSVLPLWAEHYRVNVLTGPDAATAKVANSFFVVADGRGNIVRSIPPIARQY